MKTRRRVMQTAGGLLLGAGVFRPTQIHLAAAEDARKLSKRELKALIANARTADDHRRLAAYYRGEAARYEQERKDHEEMRIEYERNWQRYPSKYPTMGDHCRTFEGNGAINSRKAAELAQMHEEIAKTAEK